MLARLNGIIKGTRAEDDKEFMLRVNQYLSFIEYLITPHMSDMRVRYCSMSAVPITLTGYRKVKMSTQFRTLDPLGDLKRLVLKCNELIGYSEKDNIWEETNEDTVR